MWRPLWVVVLAIVAAGLTCGGAPRNAEDIWKSFPDCEKLRFVVRDFWGNKIFKIHAFLFNCTNYRRLMEDPDADCEIVNIVMRLFGGRIPLCVTIENVTDETQYFTPIEFDFTQEGYQWTVEFGDYLPMVGKPLWALWGERIRPGVVTVGWLAIPKDLDPTKPFRLWYGDNYGETAPCEDEGD